MPILDRLQHAWNAFMGRDPTPTYDYGYSSFYRPDRPKFNSVTQRSIVAAVLNRIALDVSSIKIEHAKLDENARYTEPIASGLNECLQVSANIDQTGRAFMQDVAMSMLDEGVIAIVPVDTDLNPITHTDFDIQSMRTAKIVEWFPRMVKVRIYNDKTGHTEDRILPKRVVAIIESPLYAVLNEPNSTLQRLKRKLAILDILDEQLGSNKLNMIIQLPYVIKTEARRQQAEIRRADVEKQLGESKYGVAYTDGTEKIVQLNRPLDNNLMAQIEYLTDQLFSQLGITKEIMNGTADEGTMNNYYTRTIEPLLSAITDEMKRKFLSKQARDDGESVLFFRDPFKLMPTSNVAEIADKFTRNEIMTSNEIRQIVGMKPSDDPGADELRNKNLSESKEMLKQKGELTEENQNE